MSSREHQQQQQLCTRTTTERHSVEWTDRGKNACKYMRTNYSKLINFCAKRRERWQGRASNQAARAYPPTTTTTTDDDEGRRTEPGGYCRKKSGAQFCNRKSIPCPCPLTPAWTLFSVGSSCPCSAKHRAATTRRQILLPVEVRRFFPTRNHIDSIHEPTDSAHRPP